MDLQIKRSDHADVMAQLITSPVKEVEGARQTLGHLIAAIQQHRITLAELRKTIADIEASIATAQQKLRVAGVPSLSAETRRREVVEGLRDAFVRAVDRYRDRLRQKVEADASQLFRKLTTEPEYERLVINDNYGLQIQHKDGFPIEVRSSGAEHIVALSLVGALQANAPLRGPLFIDSPFGRLDENHVERVVRALPEMARQVVLLVYRKEVSEHVARVALNTQLLAEYELGRVSAIHTEIQRCAGGAM
jgi:DNA sulfur modification protein DndD